MRKQLFLVPQKGCVQQCWVRASCCPCPQLAAGPAATERCCGSSGAAFPPSPALPAALRARGRLFRSAEHPWKRSRADQPCCGALRDRGQSSHSTDVRLELEHRCPPGCFRAHLVYVSPLQTFVKFWQTSRIFWAEKVLEQC